MKYSNIFFFLSLSVIVSCNSIIESSASDTSEIIITEEVTITPSPTPIPISGKLFWDANGNGLQDKTTFYVLPSAVEEGNIHYFLELILLQNESIDDFIPETIVSVKEPGLPNMEVCIDKLVCTKTNIYGFFEFSNYPYYIRENIDAHTLYINDPNNGNPEREMRYITLWNYTQLSKSQTIEKQTQGSWEIEPQKIFTTKTIKIDEGISNLILVERNALGLSQGLLTLPFFSGTPRIYEKIWVLGYDHDPRIDKALDYEGKYRDVEFEGIYWVYDSLQAWNFYLADDLIDYIYSPIDGVINIGNRCNNDKGGHVYIYSEYEIDGQRLIISFDNLSDIFVGNYSKIQRGQIIGTRDWWLQEYNEFREPMGWKECNSYLLMYTYYGEVNPEQEDDYHDPYNLKDPFGVEVEELRNFEIEKYSLWTVYNLPQMPAK